MKLDKALNRDRKKKNRRKMIIDNRSIFLLEEESRKKFRKIRKQRIKEKESFLTD